MRKQMRVIGAVLKAHYGPDHKALELFKEAKFLYSKKSKKDTQEATKGATKGATQQAIQEVNLAA